MSRLHSLAKSWLPKILLIACGLAAGAGCSLFTTGSNSTPDYSSSAKENYDRGAVELKKENWQDAIKLFQHVRSKFGFSKWATLAELGIADANFGREKYEEAVEAYRSFIKNHPTHQKVQD